MKKQIKYPWLEEMWVKSSKFSPDSTKTAAVLFDPEEINLRESYVEPLQSICNGFPGYNAVPNNNHPERLERPEKYKWISHAERKLIALCAKTGMSTNNKGIYMHWFPCAECAKSIIDAGIRMLICDKPDIKGDIAEFWHFKEALQMLTEARVEIEYR